MKNKIKITLIGIGILAVIVIIPIIIIGNQLDACKTNNDCVLGIRIDKCCDCPSPYTKKQVNLNPMLLEYEPGRDYSPFIISDCKNTVCSPCTPIDTICHESTCVMAPPPFNVSELKMQKIELHEDTPPIDFPPPDQLEVPAPYSLDKLIEIAAEDKTIEKLIEEKDYTVMSTRQQGNENEHTATLILWDKENYYTITIDLTNETETIKSVDVQKSMPAQLSTNQYCSVRYRGHSRESCNSDKECVFCPNSKMSSSVGCHSVEFCKNLGLGEDWYDGIAKIRINHSIPDAQVKQNIKLGGQIIISNEGTEQLNVEISVPEFVNISKDSFSIPGKIPGRNASNRFVGVDVDTTQHRKIIGDIIIKSNDPNRSEIKIPINFTIISYTEKEARAVSIANATWEVQEFWKQYLSPDYNPGYYSEYFSNYVSCNVTESSEEVLIVEYYISNYWSTSNYTLIKITINSSSWEIIEKYPKIEYIKNSSYCELDDDCRIGKKLPCPCCRGCSNFIPRYALRMDSIVSSSCWAVYDCKCINNTCTAIDNNYYTQTALYEKDYTICDNIIFSGRDACIKTVAIAVQNALICDKINISSLKYECLAVIKKDESLCENISGKESCYRDVAIVKKDSSICESITESRWTKSQCFKKVAVLTKDAELCKKATFNSDRISCLAGAKQDPSVCDELPSTKGLEWQKRDCIEEASK